MGAATPTVTRDGRKRPVLRVVPEETPRSGGGLDEVHVSLCVPLRRF